MKDYNQPPTEEFAMIANSAIRNDLNGWFTLMKSVMNDYWFDDPVYRTFTAMELDHLFHKLYFSWMQMGIQLHGYDPRGGDDDE